MYQVASVLCLHYIWILPSLVQEILSGREGGTMSFCFLYPLKQTVRTGSKKIHSFLHFFTYFLQDPLSSAVVLEVWRDGVLRVKYMELPRWGSFERAHVNLPRIFSTHHPQLVPRCCWSAASTDLALLSPQAPQPTQSWPAPASSPRLFPLAMSSLVLGASAIRSFNNNLNSGWFV